MTTTPSGVDPVLWAHLSRPTYQNRLRILGRQLDLGGWQGVHLQEVEGGFVGSARPPGGHHRLVLELADDAFLGSLEEALRARGGGEHRHARSPLAPTGYEDLFRALGYWLDEHEAAAITIGEHLTLLAVGGIVAQGHGEHLDSGGFEQFLTAPELQGLLDDAFRRRRQPAPAPTTPGGSLVDRFRRS